MFDKLLNVVKSYVYDAVQKGEERFGYEGVDSDEEWEAWKKRQEKKYQYSGSGSGSNSTKKLSEEIWSFKMLKIEKTSDFAVMKKQYRVLMKRNHPDRFQDNEEKRLKAEKYTARLNKAYDFLEAKYGKKK